MSKTSLKHRIIGAIVLISLAVIFIPFLVEQDIDIVPPLSKSNIPPQPKYKFQPFPSQEPQQEQQPQQSFTVHIVDEVADAQTPASPDVEPSPQVEPSPNAQVETASTSPPADVGQSKPVEPETASETHASSPPDTAPTEVMSMEPASAGKNREKAWSIQVGSFKSKKNAYVLRDKLRDNGYPAYIESVKQQSGNSNLRVRVGPTLKLEDAKVLKNRLMQEEKLDGIIIQH